MTIKKKYQDCLDQAYKHAPFRVVHTHDLKHENLPVENRRCHVCANRRLCYICECKDRIGTTWYIGMDCHTHLEERYEKEHR